VLEDFLQKDQYTTSIKELKDYNSEAIFVCGNASSFILPFISH